MSTQPPIKRLRAKLLCSLLFVLSTQTFADTRQKLQDIEQRIDTLSAQITEATRSKQHDRAKNLRAERAELQKAERALKQQAREEGQEAKQQEKRAAAERTWATYPPQKQLCSAIEYKRFDLVKQVMESGQIDLSKTNDHCFFPLAEAANRGHIEIARYLLEKGSPLAMRFPHLNTLMSAIDLTAASKEDRTEVLDLLKKAGAGVHDSAESSLPGAVLTSGDSASDSFLKEHFNLEKDEMQSGASLTRAIKSGHANNIRWLLNNGAKPEEASLGQSALFIAITSRDSEKVRVLVEAGADVNKAGLNHQSPLKFAELQRDKASAKRKPDYEAIISYLKSKGAKYSAKELQGS